MLYTKELDSESFEDITKSALEELIKVYPSWTNIGPADPGMTIIELLAWFNEVSRYHLNVIDDEHEKRYLKLLGIRQSEAMPAKVYLKVSGEREVPVFTRFYSERICFETARKIHIVDGEIEGIVSAEETLNNTDRLFDNNNYGIAFQLFCTGQREDYFELKLSGTPQEDDVIGIYFSIKPSKYMREMEEGYLQPVDIRAQLIVDNESCALEIVSDETFGFIKSGVIQLHVDKLCAGNIQGQACKLRFCIVEGEYVESPVLQGVSLNVTTAYQTRTIARLVRVKVTDKVFWSDYPIDALYAVDEHNRRTRLSKFYCLDYAGKYVLEEDGSDEVEVVSYAKDNHGRHDIEISIAGGICSYQIDLKEKLHQIFGLENSDENILADSIALYVEEADGLYFWERRNDFDASDKYSRHYLYDEENKIIIFGDGIKGMAPVGKIYLMGCVFSAADKGNIKQGALSSQHEQNGLYAVNITAAFGGRPKESLPEAALRARKEITEIHRCVTLLDYENEVKKTPAVPIRRLKAFHSQNEENSIVIAVECSRGEQKLTKNSLFNLKKNLQGKGMIGTKVRFVPVRYCRMYIMLDLLAGRQAKEHIAEIRSLVESYLEGDRVSPGALITKASLSECVMKLAYVDSVRNIEFGILATGAALLKNGDLLLEDDCLPGIERIDINMSGRDE